MGREGTLGWSESKQRSPNPGKQTPPKRAPHPQTKEEYVCMHAHLRLHAPHWYPVDTLVARPLLHGERRLRVGREESVELLARGHILAFRLQGGTLRVIAWACTKAGLSRTCRHCRHSRHT